MIIAISIVFFSLPANKYGDYPAWLVLYIVQYFWPMLGLAAIALKIIYRNGKDMRRELLGVRVQPITSKEMNLANLGMLGLPDTFQAKALGANSNENHSYEMCEMETSS